MIDAADGTPEPADVNTPFEITVGIRVGKQADKKDVLYNARHISGSSLLTAIRFGFVFLVMTLALDAAAGSIREEGITRDFVGKTRLKSTQITHLFSVVIDRDEVRSKCGISADNPWHADGTFVSRWWTEANLVSDARDTSENGAVTQKVTGRWRADHDLRCVTLDLGTQPRWSCAEVWLLDDGQILSLNPDESAYGLHRLFPLK